MGKDGKPRGKTTAYAFFVQTCREELKKKNPNEQVVFAEFARKCGEKWKAMTAKDKQRFEDMAEKDKVRYDREMANYVPPADKGGKGKKKGAKKDPNAPKRSLSAFFCFCNEERAKVKSKYPSMSVGDVAKELGKRWEACTNRAKFEDLAAKDKARYEREMAAYKKGGGAASSSKKAPAAKAAPKKQQQAEESEEDDDDDDDEEDDYESD